MAGPPAGSKSQINCIEDPGPFELPAPGPRRSLAESPAESPAERITYSAGPGSFEQPAPDPAGSIENRIRIHRARTIAGGIESQLKAWQDRRRIEVSAQGLAGSPADHGPAPGSTEPGTGRIVVRKPSNLLCANRPKSAQKSTFLILLNHLILSSMFFKGKKRHKNDVFDGLIDIPGPGRSLA